MIFIKGQSREQMALITKWLDALIGKDIEVRRLDLFVDAIKVADV